MFSSSKLHRPAGSHRAVNHYLPGTPAGDHLVLAGPPASVSYPLIHMIESGALRDLPYPVIIRVADQLRVLVLQGEVDFVAFPTNVAANLNRGAPLTLFNVPTWEHCGLFHVNGVTHTGGFERQGSGDSFS